MWKCPKCGREFKRTDQGHYCGKAPETVAEYIGSQPSEACSHLNGLRNAILNSVPDVDESIAWSMPLYKKAGNSISFAACKKHVSLYAGMEAIEKFKPCLGGFAANKNAIYLPYDKELPLEITEDIVKWCLN